MRAEFLMMMNNSINSILSKYYKSGKIKIGNKLISFLPTSVNQAEGKYLCQLIQKFKPKILVEIGLGFGIATLWMESGRIRPKQHFVIDPYPEIGQQIIAKVHLKNVKIIKNISQVYLAGLINNYLQTVDMFFLDGDQKFDGLTTDLYFITKLLRVNGLIIARNTWNPSVRKCSMFYLKNLPYRIIFASPFENLLIKNCIFGEIYLRFVNRTRSYRFLVLQKTKEGHRPWNHFINF